MFTWFGHKEPTCGEPPAKMESSVSPVISVSPEGVCKSPEDPAYNAPPGTAPPESDRSIQKKVLKWMNQWFTRLLKHIKSGQECYNEQSKQYHELVKQYQQELQITRACQEQTARILNSEIERRFLHPAIESLADIGRELNRLNKMVLDMKDSSGICPAWQAYARELDISVSVVQDRLDALGIQIINPQAKDIFDPQKHDMCDCSSTSDPQLAGRVHSVVATGIWYQSRLLKRARVVVYQKNQ